MAGWRYPRKAGLAKGAQEVLKQIDWLQRVRMQNLRYPQLFAAEKQDFPGRQQSSRPDLSNTRSMRPDYRTESADVSLVHRKLGVVIFWELLRAQTPVKGTNGPSNYLPRPFEAHIQPAVEDVRAIPPCHEAGCHHDRNLQRSRT